MNAKPVVLCPIGQERPKILHENVMYLQIAPHPKEVIKRFRYSRPFTVDLDCMLYFTNTNRLDLIMQHCWRPGQFSFCSQAPEFEVFKYLRDYYDIEAECKIVNRRSRKHYDLWPPVVPSNWVHDVLYGLVEEEGW